jgi:hypothetical protein
MRINIKKFSVFYYLRNTNITLILRISVQKALFFLGFSTAKGELVRSILFPKPVNFKLKYDLIKCMGIFFCLGIPCMIYTAYCFGYYGVIFSAYFKN